MDYLPSAEQRPRKPLLLISSRSPLSAEDEIGPTIDHQVKGNVTVTKNREDGGPEGIRTLDPPVSPGKADGHRSKSRLLYLAELQAREFAVYARR
jgi:hypothetical protein